MKTVLSRRAIPMSSPDLPGPKLPFSVEVSSTLMQDFLPAERFEVGSTTGTAALFTNPLTGAAETLVIAAGNLGWLRRDAQSQTGWNLQSLGISATQVFIAVEPYNKTTWAFYLDPQKQLHCLMLSEADTGLSWTNGQLYGLAPGECHAVKIIYSQDSLQLPYIFVTNAQTNTLSVGYFFLGSGPGWEFAFAQPKSGALSDDFVAYCEGLSLCLYTLSGGQTFAFSGSLATRDSPRLSLDQIWHQSTQAQKLVGVGLSANDLFLLDQGGSLIRYHGNVSSTILPAPQPKKFIDALVVQRVDMQWDVYLTDDTGGLWVLQQRGWNYVQKPGVATPVWMQASLEGATSPQNIAIPFDSQVEACFVGTTPGDPSAVLCRYGGDQFPAYYQQDQDTDQWVKTTVQLPSAQPPIPATRYRTKVRLLDANKLPVIGQPGHLSANSPVEVDIAGKMDLVRPLRPVQVTTDIFGCLNLAIFADGLNPPNLVFDTDGLSPGAEIKPAAPVQDYLGGTGSLNLKEPLSGNELKRATANGQPVFPSNGWGDPTKDKSKHDADQAARDIAHVFALGAGRPIPPQIMENGEATPLLGFSYQSYHPDLPAYRAYTSHEEFEQHLTALRTHADYGGVWEDFRKGWDYIIQGIKSGAASVKGFFVDLAQRAIKLVVYIGDKLYELGEWIIDSIYKAADAVMAFFRYLGAKINEAIEWLKAVFNPKDIWDTKTALENLILQVPDAGIKLINDYGNKVVHEFFIKKEEQIKSALEWVRQNGPKTVQDFEKWAPPTPVRRSFTGREAVLVQAANGKTVTVGQVDTPEGDWFFDIFTSVAPSDVLNLSMPPELQQAWDNLVKRLDPAEESFLKALDDIKQSLASLFSTDDRATLAQIEISRLINLVEDVVTGLLEFADAVVQLLLDLGKAALGAAREILTSTALIPDWLKNLVNILHASAYPGKPHPPVTITSMVSLLLALPITLAWKIMYGVDSAPCPGGILPLAESEQVGLSASGGAILTIVGMVNRTIIYNAIDCVTDLWSPNWGKLGGVSIGESALQWVAVGQLVLETLMPILSWPSPSGIPFTPLPPKKSTVETAFKYIAWGGEWVKLTLNLGSFIYKVAMKQGGKLVKNLEDPFLYVLTGLGAVELTCAIGLAVVSDDSPWRKTSEILATLPLATQFLRTQPLATATEYIAPVAKIVGSLVVYAVSGAFLLVNAPWQTASIVAQSGTPQSTMLGQSFSQKLEALALNADGQPVQNQTVTFTAPSTGASGVFTDDQGNSQGTTTTVVTDIVTGIASVSFKANSIAGAYLVTATADGVDPANFDLANGMKGVPTALAIKAGDGQKAQVGSAFATQLQVTVTDPLGTPIANTFVTFAAPSTGASGNFEKSGATVRVQTVANGVATAPIFTANPTAGDYTVIATITVGGNTQRSVSFTLSNKS